MTIENRNSINLDYSDSANTGNDPPQTYFEYSNRGTDPPDCSGGITNHSNNSLITEPFTCVQKNGSQNPKKKSICNWLYALLSMAVVFMLMVSGMGIFKCGIHFR